MMPCGGIDVYKDVPAGDCWMCHKPGAIHYCSEWDCMLHAHCVIPFLTTEEGKLVLEHQHDVHIYFSLVKAGDLSEELPTDAKADLS